MAGISSLHCVSNADEDIIKGTHLFASRDRPIVGIIAILAWIIRLSSSVSRPDSLAGISSLHCVSNADDGSHSDLPAIEGYFDQCRKLVSDNAILLTALNASDRIDASS